MSRLSMPINLISAHLWFCSYYLFIYLFTFVRCIASKKKSLFISYFRLITPFQKKVKNLFELN